MYGTACTPITWPLELSPAKGTLESKEYNDFYYWPTFTRKKKSETVQKFTVSFDVDFVTIGIIVVTPLY